MLQDSATPTAPTAGVDSPAAARVRRTTKKTAETPAETPAEATTGTADTPTVAPPTNDPKSSKTPDVDIAESTPGPAMTNAPTETKPARKQKKRLRGKELERYNEQRRQRAKAQRQQHNKLAETWMPQQRGAVITLDVNLGSESVESWFKRTYLRHARALQRISTFVPGIGTQVTYEMVTAVREAASKAITTETRKLQAISLRLEHAVNSVCTHKAHYINTFKPKQPIYVSTKAAVDLFELYKAADASFLSLKSMEFNGLITTKKYEQESKTIRAAVFYACDSIYRQLTRLYIAAGRPIEDGLDAEGDSDVPAAPTATTTDTGAAAPTEADQHQASKRLASELALT
ncbi:MAG: hypothetical protein ING66_13415 [Rhodocyclaceae bacterium]|jgi:hypothetical protein|nr:hypothetical protein [Rhodocyclaceae bacterium]MCA3029579.1 hypothetical protein [Rhodocyclaceae bacterium]MCA3047761.1 hypothetical protein [Rhodocyclaceae bacterium]MCA3051222.1 hypothetical protein [Rhodocyclaceae bacterium]MCA3057833.1 hypothetical protein [Rhodocyclaceae bacterium]